MYEEEVNLNVWKLDSGATSHITNDNGALRDFRPVKKQCIQTADGKNLHIMGVGAYMGSHYIDGEWTQIQLVDTLFVPDLKYKLISVSWLGKCNYNTLFRADGTSIFTNQMNKIMLDFMLHHGLYEVELIPHLPESSNMALMVKDMPPSINLYHQCYSHISEWQVCNALKAQGSHSPLMRSYTNVRFVYNPNKHAMQLVQVLSNVLTNQCT